MSENWNKTNEAEIKTVIDQIKATKPTVAIIEGSTVFFNCEQGEIGLTAWDAIVALCLVLGVPVEYVRKATR